MCQFRFINSNKCTSLVGDVDNGDPYVCWAGVYRKSFPLNFTEKLNIF